MSDLAKAVVEKLSERNYKIAFAETITGGGLAKEIIKIPGSSKVIDLSVTTYSNQSKIDFLRVSEETLIEFGAVSEETVEEMVRGLVEISHADVGLAVSGIAGPGGATEGKPIGMVCVALRIHNKVVKETWMLGNLERSAIIETTISRSLEFVINAL